MTNMAGNWRVRFAPSPTGDLHVGNARTALFNWLFARHYGGRFVLRIEDTDASRSSQQYERQILEDLTWLGIDWDEGPATLGSYGPYHQSERLNFYSVYIEQLRNADMIYPCFCTEEELEAERSLCLKRHQTPHYSGKCRTLTLEQSNKLYEQGRRAAWRFKVHDNKHIVFNDLIRGPMKFESDVLGDFIIVRSTGMPAYNFAVVVDDHMMEISHVIRGEDHLSNTAMQILIYGALGFELPVFAHHALILGKDRTKLSKRHGSVSVREFREQGILPEALMNYLALLAGSFGSEHEVYNKESLIRNFSLERAGKSGAIFDQNKLHWLNAGYIHREPAENLTSLIEAFLNRENKRHWVDHNRMVQLVEAIQDNLITLCDAKDFLDIFLKEPDGIPDDLLSLIKDPAVQTILKTLYEILLSPNMVGDDLYAVAIGELERRSGKHRKNFLMPVRIAVTGRAKGPELQKIFALLERNALIRRLEKIINL